jgi:hypothetical protein
MSALLPIALVGALAAATLAKRRTLTLYHGTRSDFTSFDLDHPDRKDFGWLGRGVYLAEPQEAAQIYARFGRKLGQKGQPRVMTVTVSLDGPLYEATLAEKEEIERGGAARSARFTQDLKDQGFVGVRLVHKDQSVEYAIFDPSTVKIEKTELLNRGPRKGGSAAMAPGYRSWSWTQQDWRSVEPGAGGGLRWDRACGAKGTRKEGEGPPLCLPRAVIEELAQTAAGRRILAEQAERKAEAAPGARVPWHPEIKRLHAELEAITPKDKPSQRTRAKDRTG